MRPPCERSFECDADTGSDVVVEGPYGDVIDARSAAEAMVRPIRSRPALRRLGRMMLIGAILELHARLDGAVRRSDLLRELDRLRRLETAPFANSPMQFNQFLNAEFAELSLPQRNAVADFCIAAVEAAEGEKYRGIDYKQENNNNPA